MPCAEHLIVATTYPGQPSPDQARRAAGDDLAPRQHHVELASRLGADVVDDAWLRSPQAHRVTRALTGRVPPAVAQLLEAQLRRRRYRTVWAWSDRIGLPLALLDRFGRDGPDLVLLSTSLTTAEKAFAVRRLHADRRLRAIVSYSGEQARLAGERLGVPTAKLHVLAPPVDLAFWRPLPCDAGGPAGDGPDGVPLVVAVGWTERDYATFMRAMAGLSCRAVCVVGHAFEPPAGAGHGDGDGERFSREPRLRTRQRFDTTPLHPPLRPHHVAVLARIGPVELRDLYRRAAVVVVPLRRNDFAAGGTSVAEAMAMARPVVVTGVPGSSLPVVDGTTGRLVPPEDAVALRDAVAGLLADPSRARAMGRAGRCRAEAELGLDTYLTRLIALASTG